MQVLRNASFCESTYRQVRNHKSVLTHDFRSVNRLEDSLVFSQSLLEENANHSQAHKPKNIEKGYSITSGKISLNVGTGGKEEKGAAEMRMWENEVYKARMRVREEQDKARIVAAQHGKEMASMR